MIEIRIPKEIRTYKEKLFFGMNLRQTICTVIVLVINVPLYYVGRQYLGDDLTSWIVLLTALPLFSIGFFGYNGMTLEQFIIAIIQSEFIYPKKRVYKTESLYDILQDLDRKDFMIEKKNKRHGQKKESRFKLLERKVNVKKSEEIKEEVNQQISEKAS